MLGMPIKRLQKVKNRLFFVTFFVFSLFLNAQEMKVIRGKILQGNTPLQGVHIQNLDENSYAITDEKGEFCIKVLEANRLKITHIGKEDVFRSISKYDLETDDLIIIRMKEAVHTLQGVEVTKQPQFTAQSLRILSHTPKERTYLEKNVYTNTRLMYVPWYYTIFVGGIAINTLAIINSLTGKSKILKKEALNEKNLQVAKYITDNMYEYCSKKLHLTEEETAILAFFVMEKPEFHTAVAKKEDKMLEFMLSDAWFQYLELSKESEK